MNIFEDLRQLLTISLLLIYLLPAIIAGDPGFPLIGHSGQVLDAMAADSSSKVFTPLKQKTSNKESGKHALPINVRSYRSAHVFISMIPAENHALLLSSTHNKAFIIWRTESFSSGCLSHIWQPPRFISAS